MSEDRLIQLLNTALSNQYRLIIGEVRNMFRLQRTQIIDDTKQMFIALENRIDEKLKQQKEDLESTISESSQAILEAIYKEYTPKLYKYDRRLRTLESNKPHA